MRESETLLKASNSKFGVDDGSSIIDEEFHFGNFALMQPSVYSHACFSHSTSPSRRQTAMALTCYALVHFLVRVRPPYVVAYEGICVI